MTNSLRHIIICLLALPLFMGCRDEESSLPAEGQRTITLNLGITTRATDGTDIGDDSQPDNMQLWIFDDNANAPECLFYQNYTSPTFSGSDALGELVHTLEEVIDVANDIRTLNFYIVMNGQNATGLTLNDASTPTDIENATFSGLQQTGAGQNIRDNQVPIYGHATLSVNDPRKQHYSLRIETKRAVGKLELFFTKESEGAYLRINSIKLEQMPDIGYLKYAQESETQSVATNFTGSVANILSRTPQVVDQFLPEASASIGSFSDHESSFTRLALTHTYLLENLHGDTWAALDNNKDFTYPYDETSTSIPDESTRYKMTVAYQTSETGEAKEQVVYLPKMERNTWNKVYARVKGEGGLTLDIKVLPWEREDITVNYEDNLSYRQGKWITEDEEGNPILEIRENQTVHFLNTRATAILEFAIPTPLLAVWRAELRGADRNYFTFMTLDENGQEVPVDGNLSGLASQNGQPIDPLQIRIKCTEPDSEETHSVTLHVFASIGGQDYELNLTDPDQTDKINRFTILQSV